jgi:hypothetical protein
VPDPASAERIVVEAYGNPWPTLPDVGPFELPRGAYGKFLDFFRQPAKRDDSTGAVDDQELGTARIVLQHRRSVRLCWFYAGNDRHFSFSCEGVRYRSTAAFPNDQALALDAVVRDLHHGIAQAGPQAPNTGSIRAGTAPEGTKGEH